MKAKSMQELARFAQALRAQQIEAAARQAAHEAKAQQHQNENELFAATIGPVRSLRNSNRVNHLPAPTAPLARMRERDEAQVLRELLSDDFTPSSLLETDESLSFLRQGVAAEVLRKLRSGHWSIRRQIDLHGLRTEEAREALSEFLRRARRDGLRCLRVIHGKGHGSPGKMPVLKSRVCSWLAQKAEVMAYVQAKASDGGAGALLVLLAPAPHRGAPRTPSR